MEELLLKSLNGTKISENDTMFSQGTIYSTTKTLSMYQKMIKPLIHSTDDMKTYLTWTAKNGQTKKRYVYYSGNRVQLNTVGSLILSSQKAMDLEFSETVKLLSELFGMNTSLFHKRWKHLNIFKDDQQDYTGLQRN